MAYFESQKYSRNRHYDRLQYDLTLKEFIDKIQSNQPIKFLYDDVMRAFYRERLIREGNNHRYQLEKELTELCNEYQVKFFFDDERHPFYGDQYIVFYSRIAWELKELTDKLEIADHDLKEIKLRFDYFKRMIFFKIEISFFLSFFFIILCYLLFYFLSL